MKPIVSIIMGSTSDLPIMEKAAKLLDEMQVPFETNALSAHRTPEAVEQGEALIAEGAKVYVIDDAELERVKASYPVMWKNKDAAPKLCFVGCPHLSHAQLVEWTDNVAAALKKNGLKKVSVPTVFTAAPAVVEAFNKTPYGQKLKDTGVILSYICPLMYMNNPLAGKMPVITNSNKLRTYTTARYYTSAEVLDIITKEVK